MHQAPNGDIIVALGSHPPARLVSMSSAKHFSATAGIPPLPEPLPHNAVLMIHPTTQEVYRVPEEALLNASGGAAEWDVAQIPCVDFEQLLHDGLFAAETVHQRRALFPPIRGMDGPPSNRGKLAPFLPNEVGVMKLRATEDVPLPKTWYTRICVQLIGTNCAEYGYVYDSAVLGHKTTGHRFIFPWLPCKAAHVYHERKAARPATDAIAWSIDLPELAPTPDYMAAAGFSGEVQPLGPEDIPGCVRVDTMQLDEAERIFVAMFTPFAMQSIRQPRTDGWRESWEKAASTKHDSFLNREAEDAARFEREKLSINEKRNLDQADSRSQKPPSRKRSRLLEEMEMEPHHVYNFRDHKRAVEDGIISMSNDTWSPKMTLKPLASIGIEKWDTNLLNEVISCAIRCEKLDSRMAMKSLIKAQLSKRIWSGLPVDILARVVGQALSTSLVNDSAHTALKTYNTMRSLCRGSRALADNMLFGQLARLHDEARQLATRDSGRVPCPWGSLAWVSSVGPRCFAERTTDGVKARQRGTAQPIPCSPALVGARANALGISCLDVLRLPLVRAAPLRPYDHGGWPVSERSFIAHPNTKGYFKTRICRDSTGSKRDGEESCHARKRFNEIRRGFLKRREQFAQLLCELREINPRVHFFVDSNPRKESPEDASCSDQSERSEVLAMQMSPESAILEDERVGL